MAWVTLLEEEIADPEVPQAGVEVQDMIFMPIVCFFFFCKLKNTIFIYKYEFFFQVVVEINIQMELTIDFHHLLNVLINTSTIEQLVKEITCPENVVVVVVIQLPEVPGAVEIGEWMIDEEQLMMSKPFLIMLKTVVIEVKN